MKPGSMKIAIIAKLRPSARLGSAVSSGTLPSKLGSGLARVGREPEREHQDERQQQAEGHADRLPDRELGFGTEQLVHAVVSSTKASSSRPSAGEVGGLVERHDAAAVDDGDAVAQPLDLVHEVADEDDGQAFVLQAFDQRPHVAAGVRVQAGGELVQDGDLRLADSARPTDTRCFSPPESLP